MDDDSRHDPQRAARERQHERAEHVESILEVVEFDRLKYPVRREELATEYGDQQLDLPNETESLGDVIDRLVDEEFDSPEEVREAVYGELTGEAGTPQEANDARDLEEIERAEDDVGDL